MSDAAVIGLDLSVEAGGWADEQALRALAETAIGAVVAELALDGASEASLLFTDDASIQRLNRDWRKADKPTNVLSFPAFRLRPGAALPPMLGDIVLGFETVAREAVEQSRPLEHHVAHLLVHGVLHLLGFDHQTDGEAETMEGTESRALARLAIPDPYL